MKRILTLLSVLLCGAALRAQDSRPADFQQQTLEQLKQQ